MFTCCYFLFLFKEIILLATAVSLCYFYKKIIFSLKCLPFVVIGTILLITGCANQNVVIKYSDTSGLKSTRPKICSERIYYKKTKINTKIKDNKLIITEKELTKFLKLYYQQQQEAKKILRCHSFNEKYYNEILDIYEKNKK